MKPALGSRTKDTTPTIRAVVRDAHSNPTRANIRLYLDGKRITKFAYSVSTDRLSYTPRAKLAPKRHSVRVVATDLAGNRVVKPWTFKVIR